MDCPCPDPPPPASDPGAPDPTPEKIQTARRLIYLHRDAGIRFNNFCMYCLKASPCPSIQWANVVIARAGGTDG